MITVPQSLTITVMEHMEHIEPHTVSNPKSFKDPIQRESKSSTKTSSQHLPVTHPSETVGCLKHFAAPPVSPARAKANTLARGKPWNTWVTAQNNGP